MLKDANHRHPNIKITSKIENPTSFLDVKLTNIGTNFLTSVYHKEAAEPYVVPFQSDHARHVFVNIIECALLRALRYSSNLTEFNHERRAIKLMLLYNGDIPTRHFANIDNISITPSPIDRRPRLFRPGTIITSDRFEEIVNEVYAEKSSHHPIDTDHKDENLDVVLSQMREREIECLTQFIISRPPEHDEMVQVLLSQLNLPIHTSQQQEISELSSSSAPPPLTTTILSQNPYPPIHQTGLVRDHDRPYADYGHLNRETIAQECQFNLELPSSSSSTAAAAAAAPSTISKSIRLHAKSFAITSWTEISKEIVFDYIKHEFGIENIQYICIGEEISELNHRRHLHIQIILKEKIDRRKPFLDDITRTRCNYQVTQNDLAWNEYVKKGDNYIEFNEFKSTRIRSQKQWPSESTTASTLVTPVPHISLPTTTTTSIVDRSVLPTVPRTTTTTVRGQAEERRQKRIEIANRVLQLAETNVHSAMDYLRQASADRFLDHGSWYLGTLKYVHLRAQQSLQRRNTIDKKYCWPLSFPDCTLQLRTTIDRWIKHHFSRTSRAKCLIIIGPTGVGKTSFALSLPGQVNYYQGRWNLDRWNDYARYSVYDDIPWDDFEKLGFPPKQSLLTQQENPVFATDKYRPSKDINVRQPAIVLLNPQHVGSLLAEPIDENQKRSSEYWQQRAVIYIMKSDEYFYRRRSKRNQVTTDDTQSSTDSSLSSNEARMGDVDEFEKMYQHYRQTHPDT
ncbi:unnamed protein product [Rotaria sp. Silwood2]|nr:unnamed protein product [Rotaria sp. Silwood2]CAF2975885.1 unnamed protein product [Rotaria sp. Silwood2]CAF3425227.1 unnamed protein product [Rotaria sp. Silwood2]